MKSHGHPAGLYILFFTELWERFSYYGMRALLVLYMVNHFRWSQEDASFYYKWYTSLVYFTPLIGGFLADRYLGNKRAVIIGSVLMAIGHFMMASEDYAWFLGALIFLIVGNGFFKPNMSTQVGRLYPEGDHRRDAAYTIFYMGINVGAFLAPLVCGTLGESEQFGFHWGFGAAGVGMVLGLIIYLVGQKWIVEVQHTQVLNQVDAPAVIPPDDTKPFGISLFIRSTLTIVAPLMLAVALVYIGTAVANYYGAGLPQLFDWLGLDNAVALIFSGLTLGVMAVVAYRLTGKELDKVCAIYAVFFFIVCFWAAFEQAGNVMNLWADKHTNRYVIGDAPPPSIEPAQFEESGKKVPMESPEGTWEMPATWLQSLNPLLIVALAPLFAMFWTYLADRKFGLSIPAKMAGGIFLMGLSFVVMIFAAREETGYSTVAATALPAGLAVNESKQVFRVEDESEETAAHPVSFGRLTFEEKDGEQSFHLNGVMTDLERDRILQATVPESYKEKVKELAEKANEAYAQGKDFEVRVTLTEIPENFSFEWTEQSPAKFFFDSESQEIVAKDRIGDREAFGLRLAAADTELRDTLNQLMLESAEHRAMVWWLVFHYLLATMGELCLSPVGLSMVSKLAPAKFATMLMGVWLMTSFFGNFVAGAFGEVWGTMEPDQFFQVFVIILITAALLLALLIKPIKKMMHGVL